MCNWKWVLLAKWVAQWEGETEWVQIKIITLMHLSAVSVHWGKFHLSQAALLQRSLSSSFWRIAEIPSVLIDGTQLHSDIHSLSNCASSLHIFPTPFGSLSFRFLSSFLSLMLMNNPVRKLVDFYFEHCANDWKKIECSELMQVNVFKIWILGLNLKSYNTTLDAKIIIYDYKVKNKDPWTNYESFFCLLPPLSYTALGKHLLHFRSGQKAILIVYKLTEKYYLPKCLDVANGLGLPCWFVGSLVVKCLNHWLVS